MAMKPANAKQKQWMSDISQWVRDNGLHCLYGDDYYERADFQLHHVVGRSAKHNKVAIGHEFIIPVPVELHDVNSNHPLNVTHHKHAFTEEFGEQCGIFQAMISAMSHDGYAVPDMDIYHAIMDTRI